MLTRLPQCGQNNPVRSLLDSGLPHRLQ